MKGHNKQLGEAGELAARDYLERRGYGIAAMNFRVTGAEIDIIARDGETVVFIEVKTRSGDGFGTPAQAVTRSKKKKITDAAMLYMAENELDDIQMRFDIIEVVPVAGAMTVNHIINAF